MELPTGKRVTTTKSIVSWPRRVASRVTSPCAVRGTLLLAHHDPAACQILPFDIQTNFLMLAFAGVWLTGVAISYRETPRRGRRAASGHYPVSERRRFLQR